MNWIDEGNSRVIAKVLLAFLGLATSISHKARWEASLKVILSRTKPFCPNFICFDSSDATNVAVGDSFIDKS